MVRRAEAIYALTAQQHGGEGGVAGIEWAQRILATESDPIEFAPSTDPARKEGTDNYLAQEWGAYGAAYRSQLAEIGILGEVPGHDLPAPTPEMGNRLADAFAEAVGSAAELYYDVVQSGRVTRTQLDQFTDHKTGKADAKRSQLVDGGRSLQPLLYALAAEKLFAGEAKVTAGRLYFCTSVGGFAEHSVPLDESGRAAAVQIAEAIGDAVAGPFLPASPDKGQCDLCDFRVVCGPYEERRAARKPQGNLEPLLALRALP